MDGLCGRVMGTDIHHIEPLLCNQPLFSWVYEHHLAGLPTLQEKADGQCKLKTQSTPLPTTCHYTSQQRGQGISRHIGQTFSEVQFHPHSKGLSLAGWR